VKRWKDLDPNAKEHAAGETRYDLLANICHDSLDGSAVRGKFKVQVRRRGAEQWFQIQDLLVEEMLPQMISLSESYIQIWERRVRNT